MASLYDLKPAAPSEAPAAPTQDATPAAPTPAYPKVEAGRWNPLTNKPEPLFAEGTRVVFNNADRPGDEMNGRHGIVSNASLTTMTTIVFWGGASRPKEYSFHYRFKSDSGASCFCNVEDITLETEPASFIPDPHPLDHADPMLATELARSIVYDRSKAAEWDRSAARRRIHTKAADDRQVAERKRSEAAAQLATLRDWLTTNPGEAARLHDNEDIRAAFGVKKPQPTPEPTTSTTTGATVRINEELNGVEIAFPAKPDGNTIGQLKSFGFRWSMRSKCWYKRRDDAGRVESFARTLTNAPTPTPEELAEKERIADQLATIKAYCD